MDVIDVTKDLELGRFLDYSFIHSPTANVLKPLQAVVRGREFQKVGHRDITQWLWRWRNHVPHCDWPLEVSQMKDREFSPRTSRREIRCADPKWLASPARPNQTPMNGKWVLVKILIGGYLLK